MNCHFTHEPCQQSYCCLWDKGRQDCLHRLALLKILEGEERIGELPIHLTPKQQEVLRLMAQGRSNKRIAEALQLKPRTITNHVSDIIWKLGAKNRTQATIIALKKGLVSLEKEQ
jgi:DNA-binding NarL/FixJ family response regulator